MQRYRGFAYFCRKERSSDYMGNKTTSTPKQQRDAHATQHHLSSYVAKTLYGLEDVLADELEALGAYDIEVGRRMVRFRGDKRMLYLTNYRLHTALRILKPIYEFNCESIEDLYETLRQFEWDQYIRCDQTFLIDPVVFSDRFSNSRYVSYRVKDAIADYFVANTPDGKRPSVRMDTPDVRFNIHIAQKHVTLSLDSSGDSLHKRGYKVKQTPAPLSEVLAAGILLKAGWQGQYDLIDPMCGSGTFAIEAALIARGVAAGAWRTKYAFEEWADFDADLWREVQEDPNFETPFEHHIYASDIANDAYTVTNANVQHMGLGHDITVEHMAMQRRNAPEAPVLMVLNPPYGERLTRFDLEALYSMIGSELKHKYAGSKVWIIAPKSKLFHAIGLRHSSRLDLLNGDLECELRSYELFEGKRDDFKRDLAEGKPRTYATSRPYRERKQERPPRERRPEKEPFKGKRDDFKRDLAEGKTRTYASSRPYRERKQERTPREKRPEREKTFKNTSPATEEKTRRPRFGGKGQQGSRGPKDRFGRRGDEDRPSRKSRIQVFDDSNQ